EFAALVEQLLSVIALHPVVENLEMCGIGTGIGYRDLMRTPGALHGLAIHEFRPCPALGASQDDHWPIRTGGGSLRACRALDGLNLVNGDIESTGHFLVHGLGLVAFNEVRFVAIARKQPGELFIAKAAEHRRISDLVAIQVEDGQYCTITSRIQKLVGVPTASHWPSFSLAIPYDTAGKQAGIVIHRAISVSD